MRITKKDKNGNYYTTGKDIEKAYPTLGQIEDILEEFNINDKNELRTCLENEQKGTEYFENWWNKRFEELLKPKAEALKIIKEKGINIQMLKESRNVTNYNSIRNMDTFNARSFIKKLTKKEYDLLKEVLL